MPNITFDQPSQGTVKSDEDALFVPVTRAGRADAKTSRLVHDPG
jgi:hypothetical protein